MKSTWFPDWQKAYILPKLLAKFRTELKNIYNEGKDNISGFARMYSFSWITKSLITLFSCPKFIYGVNECSTAKFVKFSNVLTASNRKQTFSNVSLPVSYGLFFSNCCNMKLIKPELIERDIISLTISTALLPSLF